MENNALEKMCDEIVDVIYKTFTHKYYFIKITQSKKGHVYFIVRKKRGRPMGKEKNALHKKIFDVSQSVFNWYSKKYEFFGRKYFLTQNFWKTVQGIIFTIF